MKDERAKEIQEAGTGFPITLAETLLPLQKNGYVDNLIPRYDHFEARLGQIKIFPEDFVVDQMIRFENTSDPDDTAILFAISSPKHQVKGVYVDSYGLYHDDLSRAMLRRLSVDRRKKAG
jgi:hypothetical protein